MERFEYTAETTGTRLDVFLSEKQPELSRSHIQKVIESGGALVNGKAEKSRTKLKEGDTVSFTLPDPVSVDVLPEDIPLDILYEDHDVIVVNKSVVCLSQYGVIVCGVITCLFLNKDIGSCFQCNLSSCICLINNVCNYRIG